MCAIRNDATVLPSVWCINHDFVPGKARVVIVWGGSFQELARDPEAAGAGRYHRLWRRDG